MLYLLFSEQPRLYFQVWLIYTLKYQAYLFLQTVRNVHIFDWFYIYIDGWARIYILVKIVIVKKVGQSQSQ